MREGLEDRLRATAAEFAASCHLRSVTAVRARGDQRRRRTTAACGLVAAAVLAGGGGAVYTVVAPAGQRVPPSAPVSPARHTPTPTPTPTTSATGAGATHTSPPQQGPTPPAVVAVTTAGALVVLDPATGTVARTLAPSGALPDEVSVSPDGSTVYYAARQGCASEVYSVPVAGGQPTAITPGELPVVSPDGTRLAFVREPFGSAGAPVYDTCYPISSVRGSAVSVVVRDIATGAETDYPRSPDVTGALVYPISHVSWSPDGSRLLLSLGEVQDGAGWGLVVFNPATAKYYVPGPQPGSDPSETVVPVPGSTADYYREGAYLPDGDLLVNRACCQGEGTPVQHTPKSALIQEVTTGGTLAHQVTVGFANRDHTSFDASGAWLLYLSGSDLFVSDDSAPPRLLTAGLMAAAWVPGG